MLLRGNAGLLALAATTLVAPLSWAQTHTDLGFRGDGAAEAATLRLDLGSDPAEPDLLLDGAEDTDILDVHWHRHRRFSIGFSFGYRPYFRSYHYPRFYSYRHFAPRPYFYSSYPRFSYSYYPRYFYSYYPTYSYSYYYSHVPYYCPVGGSVVSADVLKPLCVPGPCVLPQPESEPSGKPAEPATPPVMPRAEDTSGTYPYDGGPRSPVPMPAGKTAPAQPTIPLEGQAVSLPAPAPRLVYPAYGESLGEANDRDDTLLIRR